MFGDNANMVFLDTYRKGPLPCAGQGAPCAGQGVGWE